MKNAIKEKALTDTSEIVSELNILLSDYQIYYQNLRGFHWNLTSELFFVLHAKFEELYNEAAETIDEIAERIRALGATPLHAFDDYFQKARLNAVKNVSDGKVAVKHVLENNTELLKELKRVNKLASENNDEGTDSLTSDLIEETEKRIWMLKAFLK